MRSFSGLKIMKLARGATGVQNDIAAMKHINGCKPIDMPDAMQNTMPNERIKSCIFEVKQNQPPE